MAKAKSTVESGKTQHQRFVEAAREMGADEDAEAFRRIVRKVATAPVKKAKKGSRKAR